MNPEIKAEWCKRLRSGKYKQGTGALNRDGRFCCLGVLCEIAKEAGVVKYIEKSVVIYYDSSRPFKEHYDGAHQSSSYLPNAVVNWAGLPDRNPEIQHNQYANGRSGLANLNDVGKSFNEIADLIEANL